MANKPTRVIFDIQPQAGIDLPTAFDPAKETFIGDAERIARIPQAVRRPRKSLNMANKPTRVIFDIQWQSGIDLPADGELYRFDVNHPDTSLRSIRQRKSSSATPRPTNCYPENTASRMLSPKKFKHGE